MKQLPLMTLGFTLFLIGCATPTTDGAFDASWAPLFSEEDFALVSSTQIEVDENKGNVGITNIYELSFNETISGYAFQATVDGNGGRKSVTFRLTIYDGQYQGFKVMAHREHNTFGVLQFNALTNGLAGTTVSFDLVQQLLISANAGRSGISETYDGMMPAIEAMTNLYLSL
jgi:hypothetical protein